MKITLAFSSLLWALLLFLLSRLFLLVLSSSGLPDPFALGDALKQFLVVLGLALFAVVLDILEVLVVDTHSHADVVLPSMAAVAGNPRIVRIITVLTCSTANTAYNLFLIFWLGFRLLLGSSLLTTALRFDRLLEYIVSFVLAFGAAHRPSWFGLTCVCEKYQYPLSIRKDVGRE